MTTSRALAQSVLVSLNGVIGDPHTWTGEHFGPVGVAHSLEQLRRSDAMLMGRVTYEIFAGLWPHGSGEYADAINAMPKYVFSSTLTEVTWSNSTLVAGDVVDGVTRLKHGAGGDLVVYGHGRFGQTLCDADLVDRLSLYVIPVFVPGGTTLFRPGGRAANWTYRDTVPADAGALISTYERAGHSL